MTERKPIKTSQEDIVSYWETHEDESGLAIDWSDAHKRCWRCGYQSRLQRCHIVPHSRGGSETPSNLVLLCRRCHREAPNVTDPRFMWIWLRATCVPFYDSYWSIRGSFEFEQMFGRQPFTGIGLDESQAEQAKKLLWEEMQNATIHFGEGQMNPGTIACIFAKVEERLTGKPAKLKCPA
ncbi:HNH endonuclease [Nostoc sp. 'Peltigera malacea cyanobiont' DB3992]|uniref:HNH endonuclease n=1 Tax=Nostoc sp. 'Peltigera malacea cyanobiont' DB3992 TaxID=1206980 RepID=UPI000C051290|nr:HNH endonuclease [Nostoc sp. 'Peltigera malacea cyanobiont' DB3992]PHM10742.1 HNH endonuclease [Nostoc sp. 'Peltigera malacea cyanobiont' DB3992]